MNIFTYNVVMPQIFCFIFNLDKIVLNFRWWPFISYNYIGQNFNIHIQCMKTCGRNV